LGKSTSQRGKPRGSGVSFFCTKPEKHVQIREEPTPFIMLTAAPARRPPFFPAPQPLHLLPCTAKMIPASTFLLGKTQSESCNNMLSKVSVVVKLRSRLTFGKGNVPTELVPVVRAHLLSLLVIRARLVSFRHHKVHFQNLIRPCRCSGAL